MWLWAIIFVSKHILFWVSGETSRHCPFKNGSNGVLSVSLICNKTFGVGKRKVAAKTKHHLRLPMIFKTYFQYGMKIHLFRIISYSKGAFEITIMIVFVCLQGAKLLKNSSFSDGCSASDIDRCSAFALKKKAFKSILCFRMLSSMTLWEYLG